MQGNTRAALTYSRRHLECAAKHKITVVVGDAVVVRVMGF